MKNLIKTTDVFTPALPAKLTFIEREEINTQLVEAIKTPGKQLVIYGHTGSGKSTLVLNKLDQLCDNYIISRCSNDSTWNFLLQDAFDQLDKYYVSEKGTKKNSTVNTTVSANYLGLKAALGVSSSEGKEEKLNRIISPRLTSQRLAEFLGAVNCCWVIEDFHKVSPSEKAIFAQQMKIFVDTAITYPEVKIIVIGAVGSANKIVELNDEMVNRVAEIEVTLMSQEEIGKIVLKGEEILNVDFELITDKIQSLSNGLGAVCHQLCLNLCFLHNINESQNDCFSFGEKDLDNAIETYLKGQSATFKRVFDSITKQRKGKFRNVELILKAISSIEKQELSHDEILSKIRETELEYPSSNLSKYLKELNSSEKKEVLRMNEHSKKYYFSNPFFRVYCQMTLSEEKDFLKDFRTLERNYLTWVGGKKRKGSFLSFKRY